MTSKRLWTHLWILPLILMVALVGCAKKQAPQPVTPPPVAEAPPPPPAPPPAPSPTPTPAPTIGSADFQPAFFDFDAYTLRDDAKGALDKDAKLLRDNPTINVVIEGHCDERRAQAAHDYLVAAGISASRLQVVSYGKERPFAEGHDEASWQQNRRAHFT